MRATNVIANSTAIVASVALDIQPRVTSVKVNAEIERAIVENKGDEELVKWLDAIDDATSDGAGKYAGATWMAAARLLKLVKDNTRVPGVERCGHQHAAREEGHVRPGSARLEAASRSALCGLSPDAEIGCIGSRESGSHQRRSVRRIRRVTYLGG